jgi:hypothetical protein
MRLATTLLVLATCVLVAGGCGGSKQSAGKTTSTTTTSESSAMSSTQTSATTSSGGGFASGDCLTLLASARKLSQELSSAGNSGNLQKAEQLFQQFVSKAPAEIKPDLQVLADALSKYLKTIGGLHLKPGKVPSAQTLQKLQQALASVNEAKVQAAQKHLDAWAKTHCPNVGG